MAIYTVKLVDRRNSGSHEVSAIQKQVERVLGLAFVDTNDSVSVSWGAGAEATISSCTLSRTSAIHT
jgi:hypothetical protein